MKEGFFEDFGEFVIQKDDKQCALEFDCIHNELILNKKFKDFLDYLEVFFTDYQIRVAKSSGHPDKLQVLLRLEDKLWIPK
jgi:hypothetical protein